MIRSSALDSLFAGLPARGLGIGLATVSALMFSLNTVCARVAFEAGTNVLTVNSARSLFAVLAFALCLAAVRRRPVLPLQQRVAAVALGVPFGCASFGYLGAIRYIPVSLAVLVVYTYPLWVALIGRVMDGAKLGAARVAGLLLAFAGIGLALDVSARALPDGRGVGLALLGALGIAVTVWGSGRALRHADGILVNFYMSIGSSVVFLLLLGLGNPAAAPTTTLGALGFAGLIVTYPLGQLALLAAIDRLGPIPTATTMNLEPLLTILLASLLLGDRLSLVQLAGAALVVGAVTFASRPRSEPELPNSAQARSRPSDVA